MENVTYSKDFYLVPFTTDPTLTPLIISVFSQLYIFGVLINSIIITVIYTNDQLHTPMYLFLCNLALVDICYTTTTVPNLLYMLLSGDNTMSFTQCFTQMYFYVTVSCTEDLLLFIMAYDRYVAICHPLHYHSILNKKKNFLITIAIWLMGCFNSIVFTKSASSISFCHSHVLHHFYCDAKALINISCSGDKNIFAVICVDFLILGFIPFMFSVTSYIKIIRVILQIKSKAGRRKAFSTCSSHLIILIIYYTTSLSANMMPSSQYSNLLEQGLTVLYTVVTPMINPLIYSLRNKDVKMTLLRLLSVNRSLAKG